VSDKFPKLLSTKRAPVSLWLEIITREVQLQPDSGAEPYYAIAQPDFVVAVAVTPQRRVLLVRQYRPAIRRFSLEFPAGMVDENEDPAAAVARKLLEETGYPAKSILEIGRAATSAGRIDNITYSFFIEANERVLNFVEEPGVAVSSANFSELRELIVSGELAEQTHLGAIALALCKGLIRL
jgi:ADP-ribose pyrophosphatase